MLENVTKKWWFWWLVGGVLLRLILMPITLHPDLWVFVSSGHFFSQEKIFNIYDYLAAYPKDSIFLKSIGDNPYEYFIYPPLVYFIFGVLHLPLRPFINPSFIPNLWNDSYSIYSDSSLFLYLFLFKLPYLFLDVILAFLLASLFQKPSHKKYAFALWMFNPLALYATFMVGQFDLIPTLFAVLALYFAKNKKFTSSILALGVGGSFKMFPLLFIFPAAFIFGRRFFDKIKYVVLGFTPFLLTIAPYISSAAFRQMALFSSKNQKMLFMGLNVTSAEVIYPFIIILTLIFLHSYYARRKYELEDYFLAILLLTFSVTHYHPQWFLWLTPLLIIYLIKTDFKYTTLVASLLGVWLLITLFFQSSLSFGLFNPIRPSLKEAMSLSDIFSKYANVSQVTSVLRSYFAGASIFILWTLSKKKVFS